jgi:glycosyltransferase involved in cell wall biosynthesis
VTAVLKTIAVDLTVVLPGGHNGGAKIFVVELLRRLAGSHPECRFVLLTRSSAHDELASLDAANVNRLLVVTDAHGKHSKRRLLDIVLGALQHLPRRVRCHLLRWAHALNSAIKRRSAGGALLRQLQADLLFCPFTAPTYFDPAVPTVCTIYDLQYKTYPEFFSPEDVASRDHAFTQACRHAAALSAISGYAKESAVRHGGITSDAIHTIHLRMASRMAGQPAGGQTVLQRLSLTAQGYLIYPANFWLHKNHEMLLTAFGMACSRGLLAPDIKLVCTGAPGERQTYLRLAATLMGLGDHVLFPGFLSNDELGCLLGHAGGMIFPSLYEGFGLPVIEAMAMGVPVACSNLTSLPEVAANAAILFDPRVPEQIADAMATLLADSDRRGQLIAAGLKRAAEFSDTDRMAREYWDLFLHAMNKTAHENRV